MTAVSPYHQGDESNREYKRASSPILSPRLQRESYMDEMGRTQEVASYQQPSRLNVINYAQERQSLEKDSPIRETGYRTHYTAQIPQEIHQPQSGIIDDARMSSDSGVPSLDLAAHSSSILPRSSSLNNQIPASAESPSPEPEPEVIIPLKYAHFESYNEEQLRNNEEQLRHTQGSPTSTDSDPPINPNHLAPHDRAPNRRKSGNEQRTASGVYSFYGDFRGRTGSPGNPRPRVHSAAYSNDSRRSSEGDAPGVYTFDNSHLKGVVGKDASLLSHEKTIELYRQNAMKTNDPSIQYEFAVFLISAAQSLDNLPPGQQPPGSAGRDRSPAPKGRSPQSSDIELAPDRKRARLLKEARQILQRLADRSFPYAQYFLADALCSGLFTNGKPDLDKAFPLFVAAAKHGHAESGYRAALHYEYGWGTKKEPLKAVQFYRAAAARNHPGAMTRLAMACLRGDLGITDGYKEGVKWLKRATEAADYQYPNAPFELGRIHEVGDEKDLFKDPGYSAQLYAQAAELGHAEASYKLGEAYEKGLLECPQDAALSIHYYTGAAELGFAPAQLALCAWYTVGAPPLLEPDEAEAYAWAMKAAERGLAKAEYTVGYFTEMGIGCVRDEVGANTWYVRAAEHGEERAKLRLRAIEAAMQSSVDRLSNTKVKKPKQQAASASSDEKDCIIM
ncbi:hypothetical protein H072_7863 [Dactylellina haptotyla CBS 200.50]|uniref:Uncharacterized protein n=1 Tax=Dactylellina haptotyla (strain CBS 200.50) TaxID=1284197 RepID=S8A6G8_DACHA|nr:hypothetical protein H072_7863 [Dactylellina haptotyla CBS 200.50]